MERWIPWIVGGLILLSAGYELWSGTARVRGFGHYDRRTRPGLYWLAVGAKLALAAAALAAGAVMAGAVMRWSW